jgi:molecular chaperone DnaK (HSP70)
MEQESNMKMNDQVMIETLERKNDLEAYIYNMRAELTSTLSEFVHQDTVPDFLKSLEENESWLYDEGASAKKNDYVSRI